jgi:hypothetical protein
MSAIDRRARHMTTVQTWPGKAPKKVFIKGSTTRRDGSGGRRDRNAARYYGASVHHILFDTVTVKHESHWKTMQRWPRFVSVVLIALACFSHRSKVRA